MNWVLRLRIDERERALGVHPRWSTDEELRQAEDRRALIKDMRGMLLWASGWAALGAILYPFTSFGTMMVLVIVGATPVAVLVAGMTVAGVVLAFVTGIMAAFDWLRRL